MFSDVDSDLLSQIRAELFFSSDSKHVLLDTFVFSSKLCYYFFSNFEIDDYILESHVLPICASVLPAQSKTYICFADGCSCREFSWTLWLYRVAVSRTVPLFCRGL